MKTGSFYEFRVCNCVSFLRKVIIIQHNYLEVCREFSSQRESRLYWDVSWRAGLKCYGFDSAPFAVLIAIKVVNASPLSYPQTSFFLQKQAFHRNKIYQLPFVRACFISISILQPQKGFFVCLMYHRVLVHIHLLRGTSVSGMRQWS